MANKLRYNTLYNPNFMGQASIYCGAVSVLLTVASIIAFFEGEALVIYGVIMVCAVALALVCAWGLRIFITADRKRNAWSNLESAAQGAVSWNLQDNGNKMKLCVSVISGIRPDVVYQWSADVRYGKLGYINICAPSIVAVNGSNVPEYVRRHSGYLLDGWKASPEDFIDVCDRLAQTCNRATHATESLIAKNLSRIDVDNAREQARTDLFENLRRA